MARSLIVIVLAVICGASAAVGAYHLSSKPVASSVKTQSVYVAAQAIRRGAAVKEADLKVVQWPAELIPGGVVTERSQIVGRSALAGIAKDEPIFQAKLSDASGSGFASNAIPKGMRACTIRTTGPSASVAGFVRPGDRVDVLLNLKGTSKDETGGGSTVTLLQAVEILAIDDILDVDSATVQMWIKEGLASVTLVVTPSQALQLSLGQASGTLSLALRNSDDMDLAVSTPVTIRDVRDLPPPPAPAASLENAAPNVAAGENSEAPLVAQTAARQEPPPTFIRTLRGSQSGQIRVVTVAGASP